MLSHRDFQRSPKGLLILESALKPQKIDAKLTPKIYWRRPSHKSRYQRHKMVYYQCVPGRLLTI